MGHGPWNYGLGMDQSSDSSLLCALLCALLRKLCTLKTFLFTSHKPIVRCEDRDSIRIISPMFAFLALQYSNIPVWWNF